MTEEKETATKSPNTVTTKKPKLVILSLLALLLFIIVGFLLYWFLIKPLMIKAYCDKEATQRAAAGPEAYNKAVNDYLEQTYKNKGPNFDVPFPAPYPGYEGFYKACLSQKGL